MKIVVLMVEGFEEIEFNTIVDILRRAEMDVTVAGLKDGLITGSHQVKVMPDCSIDQVNPDDFDAVVLPGGYPGFVNLGEDERVLKLVCDMHKTDKYIAAICGAPSVLAKAGILKGKKATIHPLVKEMLIDARFMEDRVVVDGKLITSQAPGTAMEFAMKLVAIMAGEDRMREVNKEVLAKL